MINSFKYEDLSEGFSKEENLEKIKKIIHPSCGKGAIIIAVADHPKNIDVHIDKRSVAPVGIYSKNDKQCVVFQSTEQIKQKPFVRPNNIALFLNRYEKNKKKAEIKYKELFEDKKIKSYTEGSDLTDLFDYFELIQESIIAIYTAVEAFANIAIPEDYKVRKNSKGKEEIWNKDYIERNVSLSEKLGEILPQALNVSSPKKENFWSDFKTLENYRHGLIHQKTIDDIKVYLCFTEKKLFKILHAGFKIIFHFYCFDTSNNIYPYAFADNKIHKIIPCENFKKVFE